MRDDFLYRCQSSIPASGSSTASSLSNSRRERASARSDRAGPAARFLLRGRRACGGDGQGSRRRARRAAAAGLRDIAPVGKTRPRTEAPDPAGPRRHRRGWRRAGPSRRGDPKRSGRERLPIVRELFRNLVTAEGTRAVREWNELLSIFSDSHSESPEEVLRQLIDARCSRPTRCAQTTKSRRGASRSCTSRCSPPGPASSAGRPRTPMRHSSRDQLRQAAKDLGRARPHQTTSCGREAYRDLPCGGALPGWADRTSRKTSRPQ